VTNVSRVGEKPFSSANFVTSMNFSSLHPNFSSKNSMSFFARKAKKVADVVFVFRTSDIFGIICGLRAGMK